MHKNIKIIVAYHNPAPLLNDKSVFLPIHGGREIFLNSDNVDPSVKKMDARKHYWRQYW